ncbi:hypothetical protein VTK56DRAFT_2826 [Thermocarpiscus australiensis]
MSWRAFLDEDARNGYLSYWFGPVTLNSSSCLNTPYNNGLLTPSQSHSKGIGLIIQCQASASLYSLSQPHRHRPERGDMRCWAHCCWQTGGLASGVIAFFSSRLGWTLDGRLSVSTRCTE